jgi:hypothetical protein
LTAGRPAAATVPVSPGALPATGAWDVPPAQPARNIVTVASIRVLVWSGGIDTKRYWNAAATNNRATFGHDLQDSLRKLLADGRTGGSLNKFAPVPLRSECSLSLLGTSPPMRSPKSGVPVVRSNTCFAAVAVASIVSSMAHAGLVNVFLDSASGVGSSQSYGAAYQGTMQWSYTSGTTATITVRLTNTASRDKLPDYVGGTMGLNPDIPIKVPPGTMVTSVRVLATQGARLTAVTSDGQKIGAVVHTERGHPTYEVQVAIPPGQSGELSFQLSEPTAPGDARVPVQPLIDLVTPVVSVPTCSQ